MEKEYKNNYDNPYRMLAAGIVSHSNVAIIKRVLTDKDYVRQLVQEEVRENIDIPGMFADCITTQLISDRQKVLYKSALNQLGLFFFEQLDVDRLRQELRRFCAEFGIEL